MNLSDFDVTSSKILGIFYQRCAQVFLWHCGCRGCGLGQGLRVSELGVAVPLEGGVQSSRPQDAGPH